MTLSDLRQHYQSQTYPLKIGFGGDRVWTKLSDKGHQPPDLVQITRYDDDSLELEVQGIWSGMSSTLTQRIPLNALLPDTKDVYEYALGMFAEAVREG